MMYFLGVMEYSKKLMEDYFSGISTPFSHRSIVFPVGRFSPFASKSFTISLFGSSKNDLGLSIAFLSEYITYSKLFINAA